MFLNAKKDFKLDIKNSIMIGDNEKDLVAANRAGVGKIICLGTLFKNKYGINIRKLAEAKNSLSKNFFYAFIISFFLLASLFQSFLYPIIVLIIVLLLFGKGKIPTLMADMAKGIKSFKKNMSDDENQDSSSSDNQNKDQ